MIALYMAYIFELFYLILPTFPVVWETIYAENLGIGGLKYISLEVGFVVGGQVNAYASYCMYQRLKQRNDNVRCPEFHIPLMFVSLVLISIGLIWYGWSVQGQVH